MALQCGIVGLPNVGKSTLFNCLSNAKAQAANFPFCTIEPNVGVITVPDDRLVTLENLVHPQRVVPTTIKTNSIQPNKEEKTMENTQTVGSAPVQMVVHNPETELNPLEELGNSIEAFKLKLKVAFDDLAMLSRKVKEVQIQQRQKERDFIQARRAIERIRMAI